MFGEEVILHHAIREVNFRVYCVRGYEYRDGILGFSFFFFPSTDLSCCFVDPLARATDATSRVDYVQAHALHAVHSQKAAIL
jgi:hypothetical protein